MPSGDWVLIGVTAELAGATGYAWYSHFRDWPPTGFRWRSPALLTIGASTLAYLALGVTANWFRICYDNNAAALGPSKLKGLQDLFARQCDPASYRASSLGELATFLSILLLAAAAVAAAELRPLERLTRQLVGAVSFATGLLAAFAVVEALGTRSTVTSDQILLGGWLTVPVAAALAASGLTLIRSG